MATPEQQQAIIQKYSEANPEFSSAPPELKQGFIQAITAASPQEVMRQLNALKQQYPQYIKDEGILKNKAFWIGLAAIGGVAAAPYIASALGGGGAAAPVTGGAPAGLGATSTVAPAAEAAVADAAVPGLTAGAIPGGVDAATMSGVGSALPAGGTGLGTGLATGGSILDKVKASAGKLSPILGNMAKAGADANAQRDRLLPSMESAKLARDKFALDAPGTRLSQSVKSSILKSASPTQINWAGPGSGLKGQIPSFTGGFSGALSNMDPQAKALADEILHKNLTDQLAGKDSQTTFLDQFGHESPMDKIIGGASTASSVWDAVKGVWKPKPTIMT
jgi:hypothetical protein